MNQKEDIVYEGNLASKIVLKLLKWFMFLHEIKTFLRSYLMDAKVYFYDSKYVGKPPIPLFFSDHVLKLKNVISKFKASSKSLV